MDSCGHREKTQAAARPGGRARALRQDGMWFAIGPVLDLRSAASKEVRARDAEQAERSHDRDDDITSAGRWGRNGRWLRGR